MTEADSPVNNRPTGTLVQELIDSVIGRKVSVLGKVGVEGVVLQWEPLSNSACDMCLMTPNGFLWWYASHECGFGDARRLLQRLNRQDQREQVLAIRERLIAEWDRPWPGMEFCKTLFGRELNAVLQFLDEESAKHAKRQLGESSSDSCGCLDSVGSDRPGSSQLGVASTKGAGRKVLHRKRQRFGA